MKIMRAAFLSMALPLALAAQTPAGPPTDLTGVFRNATLGRQRTIAQAFDSIPESKFSYKPTPAQLTIGYIAQHLANDNYLFCNAYGDAKATRPADETSTPDSVKATWPKDKLVASLKASFAFCETAFAQLSDAKLLDVVSIPGPNNTTRQVPRAQMVLTHVTDMADHYSQLANYMRLNNLIPPSALPRPRPPANN